MKTINAVALAITLSCLSLSALAMPVRYTYTGNPFTGFGENLPSGLTRVSGFFEVPEAFGADFIGVFEPTRFQFSNGVDSVSDATTLRESFFNMITDGSGNPTAWIVNVALFAFNEGDFTGVGSFNNLNIVPNILDATGYCAEDNATGFCSGVPGADAPANQAGVFNSPGTWTITVIPIPAAAWLFASALGMLGWVKRRQLA